MKKLFLLIILLISNYSYSQKRNCTELKIQQDCCYARQDGDTSTQVEYWCRMNKPTEYTKCMCENSKYEESESARKKTARKKWETQGEQAKKMKDRALNARNEANTIFQNLESSSNFERDKVAALNKANEAIQLYNSADKIIDKNLCTIIFYDKQPCKSDAYLDSNISIVENLKERIANFKKEKSVDLSSESNYNNSSSNINSSSSEQTDKVKNSTRNANGNNISQNGERTAEQINAEYKTYIETNAIASGQISNGDFLGAAGTFAEAGRETETYVALGGHVVTQFAAMLSESRKIKIDKAENNLQENLELYDNISDKSLSLLEQNKFNEFITLNSTLLNLENLVMQDANWLGKKSDAQYYEITERIREKQLYRIKIVLRLNTQEIINNPKDEQFVKKLIDKQFEELKLQTYNYSFFTNWRGYNQKEYAINIWKAIDAEQINRANFLLENEKLDDDIFALLYMSSNLKDNSLDKKTVNIFKKSSLKNKKDILYVSLKLGMPDGEYFYFNKDSNFGKNDNHLLYYKANFDKIIMLIENDVDFNYYMNFKEYAGKDIPFYKYLKSESKLTSLKSSEINKFTNKPILPGGSYDKGKIAYKLLATKVKNNVKETGQKEKTIIENKKDCLTLSCNE